MQRKIEFDKAVTGFLFHLGTGNRSARTSEWYEKKIAEFRKFLANGDAQTLYLTDITAEDVRNFLAHLQARETKYGTHVNRKLVEQPLSPSTVRGYRRALAAYFNWCYRENLITRKPHENVSTPKVPLVIKSVFTPDEIKALLKACDLHREDTLAARDRATVLVLLDTGVRASEFAGIRLDDVDPTWQRIKIRGKGMRERFVPLGATARSAVHRYVNFFRPADRDRSNCVFLTKNGERMRGDSLALILKYLGEYANVKDVHPHRFRRTAAQWFYERSGGNILRTQEFLGHSSPNTTRQYIPISSYDLEQVHAIASPVENMLR